MAAVAASACTLRGVAGGRKSNAAGVALGVCGGTGRGFCECRHTAVWWGHGSTYWAGWCSVASPTVPGMAHNTPTAVQLHAPRQPPVPAPSVGHAAPIHPRHPHPCLCNKCTECAGGVWARKRGGTGTATNGRSVLPPNGLGSNGGRQAEKRPRHDHAQPPARRSPCGGAHMAPPYHSTSTSSHGNGACTAESANGSRCTSPLRGWAQANGRAACMRGCGAVPDAAVHAHNMPTAFAGKTHPENDAECTRITKSGGRQAGEQPLTLPRNCGEATVIDGVYPTERM